MWAVSLSSYLETYFINSAPKWKDETQDTDKKCFALKISSWYAKAQGCGLFGVFYGTLKCP